MNRRPSKAELTRAFRHWRAFHDTEPPGAENKTAAGPDRTETAEDTAAGKNGECITPATLIEAFRRAKAAFHDCVMNGTAREIDDALAALNAAREALRQLGGEGR